VVENHVDIDPHLHIHQIEEKQSSHHGPEIQLFDQLSIDPHLPTRFNSNNAFLNTADGVGNVLAVLALTFAILRVVNQGVKETIADVEKVLIIKHSKCHGARLQQFIKVLCDLT